MKKSQYLQLMPLDSYNSLSKMEKAELLDLDSEIMQIILNAPKNYQRIIFNIVINLRLPVDNNRIIVCIKEIQKPELLGNSNIYYSNSLELLRQMDNPNYISMFTELENVFHNKKLFCQNLYGFYKSVLNEENSSMKYHVEKALDNDDIAYELSEYDDEQEINSKTLIQ